AAAQIAPGQAHKHAGTAGPGGFALDAEKDFVDAQPLAHGLTSSPAAFRASSITSLSGTWCASAAWWQSSYSGVIISGAEPSPDTLTRIAPKRVSSVSVVRGSLSRDTEWKRIPMVEVS